MKDFRNSVVYQIYPKSFLDTNGDGLGDLKGVTAKLDYLEKLGVDYIWLTPFFVSPQNDNGYDVADYRAIDPRYGTMADFEELVAQAEAHNIRIMLDMVFNHTSTYHQWFQKALAGDPVYQDYYIFRPGKPDGTPPTNWESEFGGNAQAQVEDKDSIFAHYQALIRLRHECDVFAQGGLHSPHSRPPRRAGLSAQVSGPGAHLHQQLLPQRVRVDSSRGAGWIPGPAIQLLGQ